MRFLLDNDVDHAVASLLRSLGHDVVAASEVGLGGAVPAADDEVTVHAIDRGMVVVTHDREFTARRKRHTIGLHVRLMCAQPDAVDVFRERYGELLDVVVVDRHGGGRGVPRERAASSTAVGVTPFSGSLLDPFLDPIGRTVAIGGVLTRMCFCRSRTFADVGEWAGPPWHGRGQGFDSP